MKGNCKIVESDITNAVKNYFETKKKSLCIEDFWLPTDYKYKEPDLVIISKWGGKDFKIRWDCDVPLIDMVAVESKCKCSNNDKYDVTKQSILDAVPQALVYQHFFPKVYIAYPSGNIESIVGFLKYNGIGGIPVNNKKCVEENKILESIEANNKFKPLIKSNRRKIADKLTVIALGRWKFGKNIKEKGEDYGDFNVSVDKNNKNYNKGWVAKRWASTKRARSIQWNISIGYGHDEKREPEKVYSGINIEKPIESYKKIFEKLKDGHFFELIKELPDNYQCWYYKKKPLKGKYEEKTQKIINVLSKLTLEDIKKVKKYMTTKYGGYFSISKVVWKTGITENECKKRLNEVESELRPIFLYLLSRSKDSI